MWVRDGRVVGEGRGQGGARGWLARMKGEGEGEGKGEREGGGV